MNRYRHQHEHGRLSTRLQQLTVSLLLVLLASVVLPMPGLAGVAGYLPLHLLMETVAVVIASMIFAVGWHSHLVRPDLRTLTLSCLFLAVAVLDFTHMLSFQGMPDLVTPSDPEKAINFWLAARTVAAAGLLSFVVLPQKPAVTVGRYSVLLAVISLLITLHVWFLFFPDSLPRTYVDGEGLTRFKILYEFGLMMVFAIVAFFLWRHSRRDANDNVLLLAASAAVMALSEAFFALYNVLSDIYALLGHVYKIIAFALMYRALVASGIEAPVSDAESLGRRLQATLDAMPDMMFEISADGTICQYHSNISRGELLTSPDAFLGKNLGDFMPEDALEACRLAITDIETTGRSVSRQYSLATPAGQRRYELSGSGMQTLSKESH